MMNLMISGINAVPIRVWNEMECGGYNQYNPLQTNADGKYAWDVPEGWWRVNTRKRDMKTWSDWMTVPPLRTEVNTGMVSSQTKPSVEHSWDNGTVVIASTCTSTELSAMSARTAILPELRFR